jgi:osmoprotectant transport system permease protein
MNRLLLLPLMVSFALSTGFAQAKPLITVGSKSFTEGYVLAELVAQTVEAAGEAEVIRKFGMGGTGVLAQSLEHDAIDVYPEYSGTLSEEILKNPSLRDIPSIRKALSSMGWVVTDSLGFDNTYALAARESFARAKHLKTIDDLKRVHETRFGFSHEFMSRRDGFPGLVKAYGLRPSFYTSSVASMEHALAYEAIRQEKIDVTDVYSTDAKIAKFDLRVLKDDRDYFPHYEAVVVARSEIANRFPKTWAALKGLEHRLDERTMIELNSAVEIDQEPVSVVIGKYLGTYDGKSDSSRKTVARSVWLRTQQHLVLVGISLLAAILVGIPLGVLSVKSAALGRAILIVSSVVQTIPSLALLVFLIPVFGIGVKPALVALFLYALLPIVVNTYAGLKAIDPSLLETELALGLSGWQRLRFVEIPLASPLIIAGIRTSAVIGIGTATLAALIGAGGYGAPIVTGLTLNDLSMILRGAVPAALLALLTQLFFEWLQRRIVPRGIRSA